MVTTVRIETSQLEYELALRCAWLSKVREKTLAEIAEQVNLSTAKVHRLIVQAEEKGLLRTWIHGYPSECVDMAERIKQQFKLFACHVVPDRDLADVASAINVVGYAAAQILFDWLVDNPSGLIGVGKGRSIKSMVAALPRIQSPKVSFIAVSGSLTNNYAITKEDVIHELVQKTQGKGYLLPHPHFAQNEVKRQEIMSQDTIQALHELTKQAKKIIIGVGNTKESPFVRRSKLIDDKKWQEILDKGAVSECLGSFLDIDGNIVSAKERELFMGLDLNQLKGLKVLAVVGGKNKGHAILATLRTHVITDLVLGETSAKIVTDEMIKT